MTLDASISIEDDGPVRLFTLNRPERRNALDRQSMNALNEGFAEFASRGDLRVCIVTGAGTQAFCAGADIGDTINVDSVQALADFLADPGETATPDYYLPWFSIYKYLGTKVCIAAVNGWAVGGGAELALAADIRIATPAMRIALPEAGIGSIPALGTITRLRQALPASWVSELLLAGGTIDADRAYYLGLVSEVVPQEELLESALRLAREVAAKAPLAIQSIKYLLRVYDQIDAGETVEQLLWTVLARTPDREEGRRAFIEKRRPRFTGKPSEGGFE